MTPGFGSRPNFGEEKRTVVGATFIVGEPGTKFVWHVKRNIMERLRYYWLKLKRRIR